ncbi:MAG: hypothetical protein ACOYNS_14720 [Bacteroidota bacterium]
MTRIHQFRIISVVMQCLLFTFPLFHDTAFSQDTTKNSSTPAIPDSLFGGFSDVMVAPTRVVFENNIRTAEVMLMNRGTKTGTYRIGFTQIRMEENGSTKEIAVPGPGEHFADSLIRFTPRQVIIEPQKTQIVRLQLRKPAVLEEGEYRSHLRFQSIPQEESSLDTSSKEKTTTIKLIPVYGVSIPVIVRNGSLQASGEISGITLTKEDTVLMVYALITRSGNKSLYGEIHVEWTGEDGKPVIIGRMRNVAVYIPNATRRVRVILNLPPLLTLSKGVISVHYVNSEAEGKPEIAAGTLEIR